MGDILPFKKPGAVEKLQPPIATAAPDVYIAPGVTAEDLHKLGDQLGFNPYDVWPYNLPDPLM